MSNDRKNESCLLTKRHMHTDLKVAIVLTPTRISLETINTETDQTTPLTALKQQNVKIENNLIDMSPFYDLLAIME
jgi:hypothetical protein